MKTSIIREHWLEKKLTKELKDKEVIGLITNIKREDPKLDIRYLLGIKSAKNEEIKCLN